jgi:hypothetical protein
MWSWLMEIGTVWASRRIMLPELLERKLLWISKLIGENKEEWKEKREKMARFL